LAQQQQTDGGDAGQYDHQIEDLNGVGNATWPCRAGCCAAKREGQQHTEPESGKEHGHYDQHPSSSLLKTPVRDTRPGRRA
jgi:hypothetical protein